MPRSIPFLLNLLLHGALMINQFPPTSGGVTNKIDPELKRKIDSAPTGSTWDVTVKFKSDETKFDSIAAASAPSTPQESRDGKAYKIMIQLEKYAEETQGKVIDAINNFQRGRTTGINKVRQSQCWISTLITVYNAPKDLLYLLGEGGKPEFENITKIMEAKSFEIERPEKEGTGKFENLNLTTDRYKPLPETWGLDRINAPAWWRKNYNGTGVVVGHIDSGVDIRHPSLKWNWYGKGEGWLDPDPEGVNNTFPWEADKDDSHGTHTLGIAVGRGRGSGSDYNNASDVGFFGVGVAPGARWISCTACRGEGGKCTMDDFCLCGQFLHCPNKKKNCKDRPDVVSVSLGCKQDKNFPCDDKDYPYHRVVKLFKGSGIIPVFSAGNYGAKGCTSINEPEHEEVLKVGNIDRNDRLWKTSSLGPPTWRYNLSDIRNRSIFKPDIVAPGTDIYSTVYAGRPAEFKFSYLTGTSQAAPHVAGAIALLLSRSANLTFETVREILFNYTVRNEDLTTTNPNVKCEGYSDTDWPNHKLGWGRLRLPDPDLLTHIPEKAPTRVMPPTPDYSDLAENSTPNPVRPGMVGVVIMAAIALLTLERVKLS